MKLTSKELEYLRLFGPLTYSIKLGKIGRGLEKKGLVEWVPSWMGGGTDYRITPAGRTALKEQGR